MPLYGDRHKKITCLIDLEPLIHQRSQAHRLESLKYCNPLTNAENPEGILYNLGSLNLT